MDSEGGGAPKTLAILAPHLLRTFRTTSSTI